MAYPRRYPHRPKTTTMLWAGSFFAVCGAFLVHRAVTNDRGLIINGLIYLAPTSATVFYAVLAVLSGGFVAMAAIAWIDNAVNGPRHVVLYEDAIELPATLFRRRPRRVPYARIRAIELWEVNRQVGIHLVLDEGKVGLGRSMLGEVAFAEIVSELKRQLASQRSAKSSA
jgi:hypothetical protein